MADQRAAEGALKQGFAAVESTKADIDSHLKRLEGDLSTIGSSWQGAASVQFSSLMTQWQENAAKVNQALQDLADNLRATDSSMEANESTGAANLQNCLDDLEQTLNQLRSSWEGQTQEAYDVAQRQWNQGLEGLKDVLRRTSSAVDSARSNYQTTDQSNAARF